MIDYDSHQWYGHLFDIEGSLVKEIFTRVLLCTAWATFVTIEHHWYEPLGFPSTMHAVVGSALGLLLVFRTNASYDRYWEGRKLWGGMVNECRNLVRAAAPFLKDQPERLDRLARWTAAFPFASLHRLRGSAPALGVSSKGLPRAQVDQVLASKNPPLAIAARISLELDAASRSGAISDFARMTIDQNTQLLVDYIGGCERIHKTPLPFVYVVHLRRALIMFCYSLPFILVKDFGWITIPASLMVAYVFFGIEEIGVEIEDPFGTDVNDLPLERISEMIETNLMELATMPLLEESSA